MPTSVLVSNIRYEDPSFYLDHIVRRLGGTPADKQEKTHYEQPSFSEEKVPYITDSGLHALAEAEKRLVSQKIDCLKKEAGLVFSPLEDEVIERDEIGVLSEDYAPFQRGTPFLIRKTNYATFYFFNEGYLFENGRLITKPKDSPVPALTFPAALVADLILNFAKSAASAAGNKAAMELIYMFFPDSKPLDMKELLDSIRGLVRDENVRQTIETQTGYLQGILADFNTYYKTRAKSSAPKKELYDYLVGKHAELSRLLGVLRQAEYKAAGLSPLLLGVTTLFVIEREMCWKDYSVDKAENSSNVKLIVESAEMYIKHAGDTFASVLDSRIGKVTEIESVVEGIPNITGVIYRKYFVYEDRFEEGKVFKFYAQTKEEDKALAEARSSRQSYISKIKEEYKWIGETTDSWKIIKDKPLPA